MGLALKSISFTANGDSRLGSIVFKHITMNI